MAASIGRVGLGLDKDGEIRGYNRLREHYTKRNNFGIDYLWLRLVASQAVEI